VEPARLGTCARRPGPHPGARRARRGRRAPYLAPARTGTPLRMGAPAPCQTPGLPQASARLHVSHQGAGRSAAARAHWRTRSPRRRMAGRACTGQRREAGAGGHLGDGFAGIAPPRLPLGRFAHDAEAARAQHLAQLIPAGERRHALAACSGLILGPSISPALGLRMVQAPLSDQRRRQRNTLCSRTQLSPEWRPLTFSC